VGKEFGLVVGRAPKIEGGKRQTGSSATLSAETAERMGYTGSVFGDRKAATRRGII